MIRYQSRKGERGHLAHPNGNTWCTWRSHPAIKIADCVIVDGHLAECAACDIAMRRVAYMNLGDGVGEVAREWDRNRRVAARLSRRSR